MEIPHVPEIKHSDPQAEEPQKATKRLWHAPEMSIYSTSEVTQGGGIPAPPEDVFFSS